MEPVVAYLFLTRGDVHQPGLWSRFFSVAKDRFIFSHPKDPAAAEAGFLRGTAVPGLIPTEWATITGPRAMLILLREAAKVEQITHFAFLSESCVPLKPHAAITAALRADPRPMLLTTRPHEMATYHMVRWSRSRQVAQRHWRVHPNWFVLDRELTSLFLEEDLTVHFERVWGPDEHYFGSFLAMKGYDESRINRVEATWTDWKRGNPASFDHTPAEVVDELLAFPGFFARKFTAASDIATTRVYETPEWKAALRRES